MFNDATLEEVGHWSPLCGYKVPINIKVEAAWVQVFPERCPEHDGPLTIAMKAGNVPEQPPEVIDHVRDAA